VKSELLKRFRSGIDYVTPRTLGDKMFATGIALDLGAISSSILLTTLHKSDVIHLSQDTIEGIRDFLLWGVHIFASDGILKTG